MTDRIHTLTVTLDKEYRDDDIEKLIDAIYMLKGVLNVKGHVTDINFHCAREQVKAELSKKLWDVLRPGV
jgi:hypothetical protein